MYELTKDEIIKIASTSPAANEFMKQKFPNVFGFEKGEDIWVIKANDNQLIYFQSKD